MGRILPLQSSPVGCRLIRVPEATAPQSHRTERIARIPVPAINRAMIFQQTEIRLPAFPRGFHLITDLIEQQLPELGGMNVGLAQVFIKHTSASLSLNENADPTVRADFESHFNQMVPENVPYYQHRFEGSDDMPAHIKSSLLGSAVTIPITAGRLNLGTWQGIYLCEHRNRGGRRKVVVTIMGE